MRVLENGGNCELEGRVGTGYFLGGRWLIIHGGFVPFHLVLFRGQVVGPQAFRIVGAGRASGME